MLTVIAIDPGGCTGFAIGEIEPNKPMRCSSEQETMTGNGLFTRLEQLKPDILIYERFDYRNRARSGLELISRDLIGVMDMYVERTKIQLFRQMPAYALAGYYNNDKLKAEGLYKPLKGGHANAAMMHLLQWYTFGAGYKYNTEGFIAA